ncbi:APC family permease [Leekyejoonella antrihumi]|uniref:APC family permease n=1 Tax=Leekyejoonella antrihumi TaxID=1660198 RepID=A0A563DRW4_9MICO|nr:APC family permease [Leekyejoonella antrihumi]TWP32682.1 APC family permease [Leekyejoonella antrihumi]
MTDSIAQHGDPNRTSGQGIGEASTNTRVSGDGVQRLRRNAVGLPGVLFMAVATAAPITAMVGNVPIAVGFGNGANAPAGYIVATIVLGLFALGYSAMAKHITATGAFYGYVSHGLGRIVGLAAGSMTTMAYVVFEASLVGIFSFFAHNFFSQHLSMNISWIWFALFMLIVNAALTYFDINLTVKVLGIFLITEIFMLSLMAFSVIFTGGGPQGWSPGSLNPINAFHNLHEVVPSVLHPGKTVVATGAAGIGLFFAFWSWVGFESTAMYGEESRNPKKVIPLAIMVAVIGIGLFYVFISWSAIVGVGPGNAVAIAQDTNNAGNIFFQPMQEHIGTWAVTLFEFLLMTGSYACGMAFHNCSARYIYAIGREDLIPGLRKTLGAAHKVHGSPYVAGFVQSAIATIIVLWFYFTNRDPYAELYTLMAILGTMAILIVQALTSFSVISYFHILKMHPESANWFRTFLAPLLGGIGMIYVSWLLIQNRSFAAGTASKDIVFTATPWIVIAFGVAGLVYAIASRYLAPERYEIIGRVVLDDTHEREEETQDQ